MYRTDERIEQLADRVREHLGFRKQACPDMVTAIYKMKDRGLIADYRRVPDVDLPDDLGRFDPDTRILSIRESTFIAANEVLRFSPDRARARFTIAHELGHAVLGHKRTRNRSVSGREIERIARPILQDEAEANRFAAAFLVPYDFTTYGLNPEQLATRYGVSLSVARIRKPVLDHLHRLRNKILRPLPDEIVTYLRQARAQGHPVRSLPPETDDR
ncbi:MAG: hypothetical protein DCC74_00590 [Proteobacteria bacterium]|nr:MAG: hypothetical protein DCC74_00590 [Pseudomonadota bacterium]